MNTLQDEIFMRRVFDLAGFGRGMVSPNPMVGCVIVKDNHIIGEGWHKKYGEPHAEAEAIRSVKDPEALKGAVLYVNLEPCTHHGKTPPCADLIIKYPFKKVVICNMDSNPLVAGKGIKKIQEAGIEVQTGLMEDFGREFNIRFFTFMEKKRPYVILKWAETADGFIAKENYESKWISNALSRKLVHKWRSEEGAVMVGRNTALHDNPRLNVRDWEGRDPVRIVYDKDCSLPENIELRKGAQKTLYYNSKKSAEEGHISYIKLNPEKTLAENILADLYERKISSVMIEGGSGLFNLFIKQDMWDEARVFRSDKKFEKGIRRPALDIREYKSVQIRNNELIVVRSPKTEVGSKSLHTSDF